MGRLGKIGLAAAMLGMAASAGAQQCPRQDAAGFHPSARRSLEGRLAYHDGIRKWFELKLDTPACGLSSVQLTRTEGGWAELAGLRGCRVRTEGAIEEATTGYYSLDFFVEVKKIEPLGGCMRQPPLADFAVEPPRARQKLDPALESYSVSMLLHTGDPDRPIEFVVTHGGVALTPWQEYANYWLTGGSILYGQCAEGYYVDTVLGPSEAHPTHSTERMADGDTASFDPESAAAAGKKELELGFTCKRRP